MMRTRFGILFLSLWMVGCVWPGDISSNQEKEHDLADIVDAEDQVAPDSETDTEVEVDTDVKVDTDPGEVEDTPDEIEMEDLDVDTIEPPPGVWTDVSAGIWHTCGIFANQVYCWGSNRHGQLGVPGIEAISTPTLVELDELAGGGQALAIAVGAYHSCVLIETEAIQELFCWGFVGAPVNDSKIDSSAEPGRVDDLEGGGFFDLETTLSTSETGTCLRSPEGSTCWGTLFGAFGTIETKSGVSLGGGGYCESLLQEGTPTGGPVCQGNLAGDHSGTDRNFSKVALGHAHACGLEGNSLFCWGNNGRGQAGTGGVVSNLDISGSPVLEGIALGYNYSCAWGPGGLWCWGDNAHGQLGIGEAAYMDPPFDEPERFPAEVVIDEQSLEDIKAVSAGRDHVCVIHELGESLSCWGRNDLGALGNGERTLAAPSKVPTPAIQPGAKLALGESHSCVSVGLDVFCWGSNREGQFDDILVSLDEHRFTAPTEVYSSGDLGALEAGNRSACLLDGSEFQCFGAITTPSFIAEPFRKLAVGFSGGCALKEGDDPLLCWDGEAFSEKSIPGVNPGPEGDLQGYSGTFCYASRGANAAVYCWGANHLGQVSIGVRTSVLPPTQIPGLVPKERNDALRTLSVGMAHSCAVDTSNHVQCWGWNKKEQLGDQTQEECSEHSCGFVTIQGINAKGVAAGTFHSCAVSAGGATVDLVTCWGEDESLQLGDWRSGSQSDVVVSLSDSGIITALEAGGKHTCAIVNDGSLHSLYCWGSNADGQLGVTIDSQGNSIGTDLDLPYTLSNPVIAP